MAYGDELEGIGGWLLVFVVIVAVPTPLVNGWGIYTGLYADPAVRESLGENLWARVSMIEWGFLAAIVSVCWFVTYRLIRVRNRMTVWLTIGGIVLAALILPWIEIYLVTNAIGVPFGSAYETPMQAARPFVFAAIWGGYFLRSRRVENTYRRDYTEEHVSDVFG